MLDWLNKNIGTDWATYIGLLLAIASLMWGVKKFTKSKSVTQNAKANGGNVIQVGGDLKIGDTNEPKSRS